MRIIIFDKVNDNLYNIDKKNVKFFTHKKWPLSLKHKINSYFHEINFKKIQINTCQKHIFYDLSSNKREQLIL